MTRSRFIEISGIKIGIIPQQGFDLPRAGRLRGIRA